MLARPLLFSLAVMRIRARFLQEGDWWVAWTEEVPGAITEGPTLEEARSRLLEEVRRRGRLGGPVAGRRPGTLVEEVEV